MPTSMSLNDIMAPVEQGQLAGQQAHDQGTTQVLNAAGLMQDMQTKQQKQQEMQTNLDQMKWTNTKGMLNTYMNASDPVKKALKPRFTKQLGQLGADPAILDALHDEDTQANVRTALDSMSNDPDAAAKGLMAIKRVDMFTDSSKSVADMVHQRSQQQMTQALTAAKLQNAKDIGAAHDVARVDSAGLTGGARMIGAQNATNNSYSREMGPSENAIFQANRAVGLLDKIDEGSLKSTKTLSADLNSAVASLLAGGKPSTVFGQQATHQDDIYERIQNAKQFLTTNPQDTQAPAKLAQLKMDVQALKDFYNEQHAQKYWAWREGVSPQVQQAMDHRFQTFRKAQGMSTQMSPQTAPAPASGVSGGQGAQGQPQTLETRAQAAGFDIQGARAKGVPDAQIDAYLKKQGK